MTAFPSIRIEGGLLGPDILDQLLAADLPGQRPTDFGLEARRNLTDEIAALFADARTLWSVFQNRLARLREDDLATTVTRDAWVIPFLGLLGYELRYNSRASEVDGLTFAISHRAGEAEDSPPIHIVGARQELGRVPASGRPRLAPHSLLQEYLNRTEHVWGVVTNGRTLRLLRDSTFIRRQAYIEFDLPALLEEQRFQDFVALYRLLHRTRLPRGMADTEDCLLSKYRTHSEEQGGRVREHLRDGVEECITLLANGFLRHPANEALRQRVSRAYAGNDGITAVDLYRQLLRLIYRFLFLLVSEDRGLLSPDPLYREHYGVGRLRRLVDQRAAWSDHDDLWQSLRVLWRALGHERFAGFLGLAPLNGELFSPQDLDECTLANRDLLDAFWHLALYEEGRSRLPRRVNYAALDVEELGSVYESLLEFHPAVDDDSAGRPVFQLVTGLERKTTGSYYTPPELVAELVKSALEPVLQDRLAAHPRNPAKAILSIRVCDPACGSGHFLLAAARRLGKELARVRTGEDEPPPERVREAVRDVISHCIYGVDKNPLAVDLCRVALWLESHTGNKPLTFLDHRIRLGDSLIGIFDLATLAEGIPDKAFEPLEGDDRVAARELARRNRDERAGQVGLFAWSSGSTLANLTRHSREVDAIADDSPDAIRRKKQLFEKSHTDPAWRRQKEACDLWTAAFFQPLLPETPAITSGVLAEHLAGRPIDPRLNAGAWALSSEQRFFHWPLEFPEAMEDGGFDIILSNPPWDRVKLQEQEFFAERDARIAVAPNKAARERLIRELPSSNPELHREYVEALRGAGGSSSIMRHSRRFPLTGLGDINTYAVFTELCRELVRSGGRSGIIVPTGIATDDTTKLFFQDLVTRRVLISLYDFQSGPGLFSQVGHARFKFCLLTIAATAMQPQYCVEFSFFLRSVDHMRQPGRRFRLSVDDILLLNPNTGNCPIFRTEADAEITKGIYRRVPVLWRDASEGKNETNPWRLTFKRLFDMANHSRYFRTAAELEAAHYRREGNIFANPAGRYLPLYEAKMLHQFDHRWATYETVNDFRDVTSEEKNNSTFVAQSRYWLQEEVIEAAIPKRPEPLARALQIDHRSSIQRVLCWWAAGHYLNNGDPEGAEKFLSTASNLDLDRAVARCFGNGGAETVAADLERDFPLTETDVQAIRERLDNPEVLAREMVERHSPKWFLGWRDVCRSTDFRTLISSACPKAAVGDKFLLVFSQHTPTIRLLLLGTLNSLVCDFTARQKLGGTALKYFVFKQLPVPGPAAYEKSLPFVDDASTWFRSRILELVYTAQDLISLAHDCGYAGPPFIWDEARRFEIRCELDAALFHLYLPSEVSGGWRKADGETPDQLAELCHHFPTPRHAVAFILDQFPIVRQKDERAHGRYRTKERILEIYDAMLSAQATGRPYQTALNPPPGERSAPISQDSYTEDQYANP